MNIPDYIMIKIQNHVSNITDVQKIIADISSRMSVLHPETLEYKKQKQDLDHSIELHNQWLTELRETCAKYNIPFEVK